MNIHFLFLFAFSAAAAASIVELNWRIGWVANVNLDGNHEREAIGINGQWPVKPIIITQGDILLIHATNNLNETTSLHFHGLFQNGSNVMDGALGITDCGIAPNGGRYTYRVATENQHGTYWIHSHFFGQYPDGLRFPLIIKDPKDPYLQEYGQNDVILSLSDWYHEYYANLYHNVFAKPGSNPAGIEPIPTIPLLADSLNTTIIMKAGQVYKFRFVSMATLASFQVWIDGHTMKVIEIDGIDTEKFKTDVLTIAPAQRYSVLVTALSNATTNFVLHYNFDMMMFAQENGLPPFFNPYGKAILQYDHSFPIFESSDPDPDFSLFDDISIKPLESLDPFPVGQEIRVDGNFALYNDSVNHGAFNFTPYEKPLVPTLMTVLSTGKNASNPLTYGKYSRTSILEYQKGVQFIIVNKDSEGPHPFHLHGHAFQILGRGQLSNSESFPMRYDFDYSVLPPLDSVTNPVRRDTLTIPGNGYAVVRFMADNPGVWFFHCHIQWHANAGLAYTFVEAPEQIQFTQSDSKDATIDQCKQQGRKFEGNAAGFFDVTKFEGWGTPLRIIEAD